jgi:hypothetical protein
MAEEMLLTDDRRSDALESNLGNEWQIVTEGVMGGVSN